LDRQEMQSFAGDDVELIALSTDTSQAAGRRAHWVAELRHGWRPPGLNPSADT
jgi:hypothetical protein